MECCQNFSGPGEHDICKCSGDPGLFTGVVWIICKNNKDSTGILTDNTECGESILFASTNNREEGCAVSSEFIRSIPLLPIRSAVPQLRQTSWGAFLPQRHLVMVALLLQDCLTQCPSDMVEKPIVHPSLSLAKDFPHSEVTEAPCARV